MQCRTPEEETAQLDAQAEIAPHIQDDFDIAEDVLQTLDVKDNPEYQVSTYDSVRQPLSEGQSSCIVLKLLSHFILYRLAVQERLRKRIENAKIKILNPARQGKKVVVLDIDYTIFDLNSTAGRSPCPLHFSPAMIRIHRSLSQLV